MGTLVAVTAEIFVCELEAKGRPRGRASLWSVKPFFAGAARLGS
jgi:hypothetical protein